MFQYSQYIDYRLSKEINKLKIIEGEKSFLDRKINDLEAIRNKYYEIEKKSELIAQEKNRLEVEKLEWQNEKSKLLKEISYNIIQENIKYNSELQDKGKKEIENITKNLYNNFSSVLEKVSLLNDNTYEINP